MNKIDLILKKKHIDMWTLKNVSTVKIYNLIRRYKLINKKLTEEELKMLKEFSNKQGGK